MLEKKFKATEMQEIVNCEATKIYDFDLNKELKSHLF